MNMRKFFDGFENFRMGFYAVVKGNHGHMIFLDTPLHVDAVTDASKLPCHKYLKGQ
jgi:hypothetical protein